MTPFESQSRCIGVLTSGGDCPGLNSALRGITKAAIQDYNMKVVGILDGFRGLVENRTVPLDFDSTSGVLTRGGTLLGTSRDKPRKMQMGGKVMDMTQAAVDNARKHDFDCVVCLGGGGTQKNAWHLHRTGGLDVMTLPKTIDNDVAGTDVTFGFDTAVQICTEAIDRLHTTATSHDRIIVVEVMGHNTGWLALAAGIAGGADVILIPEIPYEVEAVVDYLKERQRRYGKRFSIVCVAEGAMSAEEAAARAESAARKKADRKDENGAAAAPDGAPHGYRLVKESLASRVARDLQQLTRTEARVTSLGHVQRGGVPSAADRLLTTRLGTTAVELLAAGTYNVMVAVRDGQCVPVPLGDVAGKKKLVPIDHDWIDSARRVGTCLGVTDDQLLELMHP
ncbi:ATP-dependent 6-phosphofructokinase [bacterium]|nr:ATP-dependent 6-phosphofructokinase [bacterium]